MVTGHFSDESYPWQISCCGGNNPCPPGNCGGLLGLHRTIGPGGRELWLAPGSWLQLPRLHTAHIWCHFTSRSSEMISQVSGRRQSRVDIKCHSHHHHALTRQRSSPLFSEHQVLLPVCHKDPRSQKPRAHYPQTSSRKIPSGSHPALW